MSPTTTARMAVGLLGVLLAAAGLAGCGGDQPARPAATTAAATTRPGTVDAERCPVTRPRDVGPPGVSPRDFFGWASSYGNGRLWVGGLWPGGVVNAGPEYVAEDGSFGMKFGWWRAAPGKLAITGRRLDAPAPPARGFVPDGYGDTGFQASGVDFPTEGCWEVTGALPTARLTFVTLVVKKRAERAEPGVRAKRGVRRDVAPLRRLSGPCLDCVSPRAPHAAHGLREKVSPDCSLVLAFDCRVDSLPLWNRTRIRPSS